MLLLKMLTVVLLLLIFLQDLRERAVYWFLFPLLAGILAIIRIQHDTIFPDLIRSVLINIGFIAVQLTALTLYFSLRSKNWVLMTTGLLGLGDILFLLSLAVYLPVLNFILFYILSLITVLMIWLTWQFLVKTKHTSIPLAGLQSVLLIALLMADWWYQPLHLTDDAWLLNLIAK